MYGPPFGSTVDRLRQIIREVDDKRLTALHERNEARSEIERHHALIVEMRDLLDKATHAWTFAAAKCQRDGFAAMAVHCLELRDRARELLNREVG